MGAVDIKLQYLLIIYTLLIIPTIISIIYKLKIIKSMLIAVLRMTVQLTLVGLYLEFIFRYDNLWLNLAWVLIMITTAGVTVIRNANLKIRPFLPIIFIGLVTGSMAIVSLFILITIRPTPFYKASYLIPLTGMLLGNCLKGNIISLERFYYSIRKNETEYIGYLMMGATLKEAIIPYLREAIKPAIAPTISSMATLGLVSLPGMMTGQILGGSTPIVAIKYQIAIMIAILTVIIITTTLNILLSLKVAFNNYQVLRKDIFRE